MTKGSKNSKPKSFEYKAEMKQLLKLIIHSLYTHNEIFLRELVSNASDALNKIRFIRLTETNIIDSDSELRIDIRINEEESTFEIEDSGIGMTYDDLINQIGTIASSGTIEFFKQLEKEKQSLDARLIGQFGVGFYSVFMVTDEVTIETRHYLPESKAYTWRSVGEDSFEVSESERPNRGTKISFKLKEDQKEYCRIDRIKEILRRYSNFVDFPVYVNGEKVNMVTALWHRKKEDVSQEELDEFYEYFANDYQKALGHLHLAIEGNINFKSLLFIPETPPVMFYRDSSDNNIHLYSSRVFIHDDAKELLPDYLRFIKGVVDSDDLPLNVSREVTQNSPLIARIKTVLTSKILAELEDWSVSNVPKYEKFWKNFGSIFKMGINSDFTHKDKIVNLLRFETTLLEPGQLTSLKDYVSRMPEGQSDIYYIAGENREQVTRNPNLEYFRKNNIEVLLLTDPVDIFTIPYLYDYEGKKIKSIEKSDLNLNKEENANEEKAAGGILDKFKEILGEKVEAVVASQRLVESPVTLVVGKQGVDSQTERIMQHFDKDFSISKRILEVNLSHPIIKNLQKLTSDNRSETIVTDTILNLFEGALLIEGQLKSPSDFIERMNRIITEATK